MERTGYAPTAGPESSELQIPGRRRPGATGLWPGDAPFIAELLHRAERKWKVDAPRRVLGFTTLGNLKEHPRIVGLRSYIENWYLSYFVPDAARSLPQAGAQKHLNRTGENLGNVVQYLERAHPDRFQRVLDQIARKIPGIQTISHERSPDGRLLLRFNEQGYEDPFYQQSMSDGTLKMFMYLLLLEDPEPFPLIGIEEPENGLYHKLLEELARELVQHAAQGQDRTQLFVTTHSPYFVDALQPDQVWLLEKNSEGKTQARRTSEIDIVREMIKEDIPLGSLWYSNQSTEGLLKGATGLPHPIAPFKEARGRLSRPQ